MANMFSSLSDKLSKALSKFKNKGKLTEADIKEGMREIKLALLEADVGFRKSCRRGGFGKPCSLSADR